MEKEKREFFKIVADESYAKEQVMLGRLNSTAQIFYKNSDNLQAFKAWKKNKEANHNEPNYSKS